MILNLFRYYWIAAAGYRLNPWQSPYIRWRFETFLGPGAAHLSATNFFRLSWKYRLQLGKFADWAAQRRRSWRHA